MELLKLLDCLVTVTFIGFNILYLLSGKTRKMRFAEELAISFGLGLGAVTLEMLIFSIMRYDFDFVRLLAPWAVLFAVNIYQYIRGRALPIAPGRPWEEPQALTALGVFLAAGITFEVIYAFFRALIKPIEAYDAVAIYAIKSKIFYLANSVSTDYLANIAKMFPHPDYPLNIPLAQAFSYLSMGSLNDQLVKIIFPLFFVAILCLFYCQVRAFAGRLYALTFTFLLASIPQFNAYAANAYLEVPLAFYYFASFVFLLRWFGNKTDIRFIVMSAIMVALAGWTKNEGLLYCAINTFVVCLFLISQREDRSAKDILYPILYAAVIAVIVLPWAWTKARWHIANDEISLANLNPANLVHQFNKLKPIFYELQKQLFGPKKWNILWPAFFLTLTLYHRKIFSGLRKYLAVSILLAFAGYVAMYMISSVDVVFFAGKTWSRFLIDFLPVAVLMMAMLLREDIKL